MYSKALRIGSLIETVEKRWGIAQDVVFCEAHCSANRDAVVEEIMVRKLSAFIRTRMPSTDGSKMHGDSLWLSSCPTSSWIQYVELAHSEKTRKTL